MGFYGIRYLIMNNISLKQIFLNLILFLCIYYLSFTFISASLDKIIDPHKFSEDIAGYGITPNWMNNIVAIILPWIELFCGIFLFLSLFKKFRNFKLLDPSNNLIIGMLIWFIFILSIATIQGLDIDCGCGLGEKVTPFERLVEDIVLLIISFIIKFRGKIKFLLNIKVQT